MGKLSKLKGVVGVAWYIPVLAIAPRPGVKTQSPDGTESHVFSRRNLNVTPVTAE